MPYADLHIHTYFSDSTLSPEEVVAVAASQGLSLISICDHDTIAAYDRLRPACKEAGIQLIQGVEIDVLWRDMHLHLLAYAFDPEDEGMNAMIRKCRHELDEVSIKMLQNMLPDYLNLSMEDYAAYEYNPSLGAWKGIHYLLDRGYTETLDDGYAYYAKYATWKPDYCSLSNACRAIKAAGGVPVLAHPGCWWTDEQEDFGSILTALMQDGVCGIECYYPAHSEALTRTCLDFCRNNGLAVTYGGDGHGEFSKYVDGITYAIGIMKVPMEMLDLRGMT